ncbi:MAG: hypothetical protein O3A63_03385 [Proteobacteria bacterium]|nr:hypothetical protein [Pseudomonadota bacterium]
MRPSVDSDPRNIERWIKTSFAQCTGKRCADVTLYVFERSGQQPRSSGTVLVTRRQTRLG